MRMYIFARQGQQSQLVHAVINLFNFIYVDKIFSLYLLTSIVTVKQRSTVIFTERGTVELAVGTKIKKKHTIIKPKM